jgi:hypothetical protein
MPPTRIKRSNTLDSVPAALDDGELAINQASGTLYYHTSAGGVGSIASGSSATIEEYDTTASFPATGRARSLYVATDTGKTYHWINDALYVEIGPAGSPGQQGPTGATGPTGPIGSISAATSTNLGGVKTGSNVTIAADGTLSVAAPVTTLPYTSITGTPTLATVATTGSYNDLTNKPSTGFPIADADARYVQLTDTAYVKYTGGDARYLQLTGGSLSGAFSATTVSAATIAGTGGRSLFADTGNKFAVGVRYNSSGGHVYLGATDATGTPGLQLSNNGGSALLSITNGGAASIPGSLAVTGSLTAGGSAVVVTTDSRLSDARTPLAHTQAASTITGLASVATSGSASDLNAGVLPSARMPVATTSALGAVSAGSGLSVSAGGTLSANVTSVAGRTGAVTITAADIGSLLTSDATGISGASSITNVVVISAPSYAALSPKSSTTLYLVY